jgi:alpha-N-arabinofuranosidase
MNGGASSSNSGKNPLRATITVRPDRPIGAVSPLIYGHFTEHFPRCIYGGYFDPDSPCADGQGLREDVLEAVRRVRPGIMRWPGGNYVSAYHWKNGVGDRGARPVTYDPVWQTQETNKFGTGEFVDLCRKTDAEPYMCLNLGTGSLDEAMQWVQYCNLDDETRYAALRRDHGHPAPFNVKYWGLGNEMYGPWQMNAMDAQTYGKVALEYAKAIKWVDPSIKVVAVAGQDTDWQIDVLRKLRDPIIAGNRLLPAIDYVSIHAYFARESVGFYETMAAADYIDAQTRLLCATIRSVYGYREFQPQIAWDEWNFYLWAHYERAGQNYRDDIYDLKDALFTASVLNSFIRNCDIVGMANYSPFVNIRGAVCVEKDRLLLRAPYHVFDLYANHAEGVAVETSVDAETFAADLRSVAASQVLANPKPGLLVDAAATKSADGKRMFLSIVNRHHREQIDCTIDLGDAPRSNRADLFSINAETPSDSNTVDHPDRVTLQQEDFAVEGSRFSYLAPAHSVTAFLFRMK